MLLPAVLGCVLGLLGAETPAAEHEHFSAVAVEAVANGSVIKYESASRSI